MAKSAPKESKTPAKTQGKAVPDAETQEDAPPPKKKRSMVKLLLILVPLLGATGGGAWYFLQGHEAAPPGKAGAAKGAAVKAVSSKPPVFAPLEPFTVNLQHEDAAAQFLQVGLSLKLTDGNAVDAIKLRMPEIRNRILLLLSSKKASEISTLEGKQALSTALMEEIAQPLAGSVPAQAIESVLFTSFVIQ
jgi:flagellar FliL protein